MTVCKGSSVKKRSHRSPKKKRIRVADGLFSESYGRSAQPDFQRQFVAFGVAWAVVSLNSIDFLGMVPSSNRMARSPMSAPSPGWSARAGSTGRCFGFEVQQQFSIEKPELNAIRRHRVGLNGIYEQLPVGGSDVMRREAAAPGWSARTATTMSVRRESGT